MVSSVALIFGLGLTATATAEHDSSAHPEGIPVPHLSSQWSNAQSTTEANENVTCGEDQMARTDWYAFVGTGGTVVVATEDADFDTMLAVYGEGIANGRECNDDRPDGSFLSLRAVPTRAGARYLVQIGSCTGRTGGVCDGRAGVYRVRTSTADLDGDGDYVDCNDGDRSVYHGAPEILKDGIDQDCSLPLDVDDDGHPADPPPHGDCDDANPSRNPSEVDIAHDGNDQNCDGADNLDEDGDGVNRGITRDLDCDDKNQAISPRRNEISGNRVDEDCLGGARPGALQRPPNIRLPSIAVRGGRRFEALSVSNIARNFKVSVRCTGSRRCPRRQTKMARSTHVSFGAYDRRVLRPGAKVKIYITRPDGFFYGVFKQYRVRRGSATPRQTNCELHPDRPTKPIRCSS